MGLDIYHYKVLEPKEGEMHELDCDALEIAKAIFKDKVFLEDTEYITLEPWLDQHPGYSCVGESYTESGSFFHVKKEDSEIILVDMNDCPRVTTPEHYISVKEIGYQRKGMKVPSGMIDDSYIFTQDMLDQVIANIEAYYDDDTDETTRQRFIDNIAKDFIEGETFIYMSW